MSIENFEDDLFDLAVIWLDGTNTNFTEVRFGKAVYEDAIVVLHSGAEVVIEKRAIRYSRLYTKSS